MAFDDAVSECFSFLVLEFQRFPEWAEERNTISKQDRDSGNDDFINQVFREDVLDNHSAIDVEVSEF